MDELPTVATLCEGIDAADGSSLERLDAAVRMSGELRERGDQVVDRYVQAARAEGRSWTQVGDVLGVSKQAAQQRFVALPLPTSSWPGMNEAASVVIGRAVKEARALGHRYPEPSTCSLAADDRLAGATLARLGVSPRYVAEQIHGIIGPGHSSQSATLGIAADQARARGRAQRCAVPRPPPTPNICCSP